MRRASFQHTQAQMRTGAAAARASADGFAGFTAGGKDVTRRLAWRWATPGLYLLAVSKSQGIRPGEIPEVFGVIEILAIEREPLVDISRHPRDCAREGFPEMSAQLFVAMFREHMGCQSFDLVARVVFRHVDVRRVAAAWGALTLSQRHTFADGERAA